MNSPPSQATPAPFERDVPVRFAHCDPAGIIFFPQYLVMFNNLVEDWVSQALGIPYAELLGPRRTGLPTVHLSCDFNAISRMGETITLGLGLQRLGSRSITLALQCRCGTQPRVQARQVLVCTSLQTHLAIAIPSDLRAALEQFQHDSSSHTPC